MKYFVQVLLMMVLLVALPVVAQQTIIIDGDIST